MVPFQALALGRTEHAQNNFQSMSQFSSFTCGCRLTRDSEGRLYCCGSFRDLAGLLPLKKLSTDFIDDAASLTRSCFEKILDWIFVGVEKFASAQNPPLLGK